VYRRPWEMGWMMSDKLLQPRGRAPDHDVGATAGRFGKGLALSLVVAMSTAVAAPPAKADVPHAFWDFFQYVKDGYDFADKYILNNKPSDLAQLVALINQVKTQIIAELDGLSAAWDSSCAANAVDTFQSIDQLTTDNLQAFAISSDKCVTDAQARIEAVSTKAAIDKIGFALNTVGPIALAANARAGFPTNVLRQHIIEANKRLQTKLVPACGVSVDNPADLPSFSGPVTGHGACYNYTFTGPTRVEVGERGGVFYLPHSPGTAFLSWPLLGYAVPDDDILWWRGHTAHFPDVDFSIAVNQVMQGTSWQVAGAALDKMLPTVGPPASPVALTVGTDKIFKPMDVFRTGATDNVSRAVLNPYPDGANPTFAGWYQMDGDLRSLASAGNFDGRVEMFGVSRIGNIFHRWQQIAGNDSSWSPWAQMDGQLNSITVARNHDGTLQVFGTNPAGNIWTRNQVLGGDQYPTVRPPHPVPGTDTWTAWKQMDGALSQVAAVTDPDGLIHLFGVNSAGMLFHRRQTARDAADPSVSGAWTGWDRIQSAAPLRSIAATIDLGGRVNLFAITNDDRLFQRVKLSGSDINYTGWAQIPGSMHFVAAVKEGGGQAKLVLIGVDIHGAIYRNTSDGLLQSTPNGPMPQSWRGWTPLPTALGGIPAVTSPGNQKTLLGAPASVALSASGGTLPYSWTVSGLPPGLAVTSSSISGSPTAAGPFTVSVLATDVTGEKSNPVSFTWTVAAIAVPDVTGMRLPQATGVLRSVGLGLPSQHNVVDQNCNQPPGTVTKQTPSAGAQVAAGYVVSLSIETWPTDGHVCN
jgi:tectonin-like protein/PASTA domain-containing protein